MQSSPIGSACVPSARKPGAGRQTARDRCGPTHAIAVSQVDAQESEWFFPSGAARVQDGCANRITVAGGGGLGGNPVTELRPDLDSRHPRLLRDRESQRLQRLGEVGCRGDFYSGGESVPIAGRSPAAKNCSASASARASWSTSPGRLPSPKRTPPHRIPRYPALSRSMPT